MKNKVIIGISSNIEIISDTHNLGKERSILNQDYVKAVIHSGGVPLILPIIEHQELIEAQVSSIDALVISGGYDVHPFLYNEEPHILLENVYPERDHYEKSLIETAYRLKKPILGICRGMQLLNVVFGGSLYQDVSLIDGDLIQHRQKSRSHSLSHCVYIVPDTRLFSIFKQEKIQTNSYHHQAVKRLAPEFKISAKAKDGVIEGIEKEGDHFILGVQWHPEGFCLQNTYMLQLFRELVHAAHAAKGTG